LKYLAKNPLLSPTSLFTTEKYNFSTQLHENSSITNSYSHYLPDSSISTPISSDSIYNDDKITHFFTNFLPNHYFYPYIHFGPNSYNGNEKDNNSFSSQDNFSFPIFSSDTIYDIAEKKTKRKRNTSEKNGKYDNYEYINEKEDLSKYIEESNEDINCKDGEYIPSVSIGSFIFYCFFINFHF
jgi:hypothetical protein